MATKRMDNNKRILVYLKENTNPDGHRSSQISGSSRGNKNQGLGYNSEKRVADWKDTSKQNTSNKVGKSQNKWTENNSGSYRDT